VELFERREWQMAPGERAAIAGVLAELRPRVAIEIGTAQGGSLRTIAAYSGHVHTFDFAPAVADPPPNVTFHAGDSHKLLPGVLAGLEETVGFVLVDGDHSTKGVHRDLLDLLSSPALGPTVVLAHDSANAQVRAGLERVDYRAFPRVRMVDFAFVDLQQRAGVLREEWGGLALIVVGAEPAGPPVIRNLGRPQALGRRTGSPARAAIRRAHALLRRWA
jgi:hypothetical protein